MGLPLRQPLAIQPFKREQVIAMKLINTSFLPLLITASLLSACGGSSGGSTPAATETPSSSSLAATSSSSSAPSSSSSSKAAVSSSSSIEASSASSSSTSTASTFKLTSASFLNDATIPNKYTCDGIDINPQLSWEGAPAGTKSFAVIVDDPDAFAMFGVVWVHWNIYNISAATTELAEGVSTHADKLPLGTIETNSDFGSAKYRGPCPPSGRHHYMFQVYALNKETISFTGPLTRGEFETSFADSIIDKAVTTGYFR
jgi:Raf kinase inhibitor-like YbhB/YbcL family protein